MNLIKKISRTFLLSLLTGAFLLVVGYILFRSKPFQNWAAQKTVTYLSKEFKTVVRLKSIDFKLINTLILEGLYIEDQQGDTMVYFGKLKTNFNYKFIFNSTLQLANLKHLVIENSKINMVIHPGQKYYNYEFLLDYFTSPVKSDAPFVPFKLFIKQVEFNNVDFCLRDKNLKPAIGRKFDENFMVYRGINASIKDFKLVGDSLNMDIKSLSFIEKSGLEVKKFSAITTISPTVMEFFDLTFETPNSTIGNYLQFKYHGWGELSRFVSKVQWEANLAKAKVDMKDISYFSDDLKTYSFISKLNGNVTGTLEKLKGKNMEISLGSLNKFKGDILLVDMIDPDKLNFDFSVFKLTANPSSIGEIFKIDFPIELLTIGSIDYSGNFKGSLKDFTSTGLFETTIGEIRTDLNLQFPEGKPEKYKGEIEAFNLNLTKLLNDSRFGTTSFYMDLDGEGFSLDNLNTKLLGNIDHFGYEGYNYTNMSLDGFFDKKIFNGKFDIEDPNVNISLNGAFNLIGDNPGGDFKAVLGIVNLKTLGYGDINIKRIDNFDIHFSGKDIDDLEINADLNNVVLERKDSNYYLGTIDLKAYGLSTNRSMELRSILGNLSITGQYKLSQFNTIYENLIYNLFPDYYLTSKTKADPVNIRFDIDIEDSRYLSALVLPDLSFYKFNTSGVYNSANQSLDVLARSDFIKYQNYTLNQVKIEGGKQPNQRLSLSTTADNIFIDDSFFTNQIELTADLGGNDINFKLNASDTLQEVRLRSGGHIAFSKFAIDLKLNNSTIFLHNKPWEINNNNNLHYENSELKIDSFKIFNGNQYLTINGQLNDENFNNLKIDISTFDLTEINPILKSYQTSISGIIKGKIALNGKLNRPLLLSNIDISKFVINQDSVGDVHLESHSDINAYKMIIDANIKNGLINDMQIDGYVDITPNSDKIDLTCKMTRTSIKPFEIFTEGLFSKIYGIANGNIKIKGRLDNPSIGGSIYIDSAGLFMDYLGLPLKIAIAKIDIDENKINLNSFEVKDKFGSKADVSGKIYHTNFDNLRFDITMDKLNNFNCMNLTEDQNDLFFGTAFVDGNMKVTGSIDDIKLKIKAKTREKTSISLPLTVQGENEGPDFIKLVDLTATNTQSVQKKLSGITMDFNFDITEDAEVKLIFDSKFNDVMSANGNGNIKMELNTFGDFSMYGSYQIQRGQYNFTALNNLLNTNLKVKEGSKITWQGDPLAAQVDILAITTVKANPTVLLPSSTENLPDVYVDCEIRMKEELFKPEISLGINLSKDNQTGSFPNNDVSNAINRIKADQEETNKQFVNLLVFRTFAPLNSGVYSVSGFNAISTLQSSVGDFLTSQVNNWLRQIAPDWELDVDYQTATSESDKAQVIVKMGRKLLNDKVFVEVGAGQGGASSYDINVSYKPRKDGKFKIRGFNTRANDPSSVNNKPVNTQGLGLYYRKEMDYLFKRKKN